MPRERLHKRFSALKLYIRHRLKDAKSRCVYLL